MLDNILIIVILSSIILSFFIVKIWRKNNFVKELYIDEGVSNVFYIITIASTIGLLIIHFVTTKGLPYSWLYLLIVLSLDLLYLFVFCLSATTCIYLKDNILIQKNIFCARKILISQDIKIIEKTDKTIIVSRKNSISISSRCLNGSINNLIYKIKIMTSE